MQQKANFQTIGRLMLRLLPVQVLLAAVGAVNGIVSSFFASNFVGVDAMSAVGLYSPLNMLFSAISMMLVGGSSILCGKYMGQNEQEKMQSVFSASLALTSLIGAAFALLFVFLAVFDFTGFMTQDAVVRPLFNRFLLGQAVGVVPFLVGSQLPAFLAIENRERRTTIASLVYIAVNVALNFLFVQVMQLEAFGLALASSLGLWVFLAVQAQYYASGQSFFRFSSRALDWREGGLILSVGLPGAANNGYQTVRGIVVNRLLEAFVGVVGISAFAAADNLLRIFWAIPFGMLAVSRLLISVSIGEEDRQSLTDVMRVMFRRYLPLMGAVCACIILLSEPLTRLFFRDPAQPVYMMTVWGLRILPLCMPLSIICIHFIAYGQASGKQGLVHLLSLLDGVVCVVGFTALLIRAIGMNSLYIANVLNGVVCVLVIVGYACIRQGHFPRTMDELMVVPADFGAAQEDRLDLGCRSMEDVVTIAERVQAFCISRGIDARRSYLSGLAMEEMAGNIVSHGFSKDKKPHSVDVRVVYKAGDVVLRLRDDCVPFDPGERLKLTGEDDPLRNIGIRMIYRLADDIDYRILLGLNVLTIRIGTAAQEARDEKAV